MTRMEEIKASVTVTNTGNRPGEEVVQLYIQDLYGSVVRPVNELKGFKKIFLNPGESERVTFTIKEEDLKYYTSDMNYKSLHIVRNVFYFKVTHMNQLQVL
ncbi:fibronectin type III-like domain-contianing protein [Neobacillus drentensis]|uniref:fibronectin type III-like domain-contianing protein n=1 Tax=Neobacillus drentensis TaxID=220684 RepID=UPI002FFECE50